MRSIRIVMCCLCMVIAGSGLRAAAADACSVAGTVRDDEGRRLVGVRITLSARETRHSVSGDSGEYCFSGLATGEYALSAESTGYLPSDRVSLYLESLATLRRVDLILRRPESLYAADKDAPMQGGSSPPLEFQASSIQGLIDPGGYSASTGSAAATDVLKGIADVKRADSIAVSELVDWPCSVEAALKRAVREHPDDVRANRALGEFYLAHNNVSRAIPPLERVLQSDASAAAARDLAEAWLRNREFNKARRLLTEVATKANGAMFHDLLAQADEGLGLFEPAALEYRTANEESPSEIRGFGLGYELVLAGSPANGAAAFESSLYIYPRSVALRIGLGTALLLEGKESEAITKYLEATEIDPTDPRPYSLLSAAYRVAPQDSERIRRAFKEYLDRKPGNALANYYYADALFRRSTGKDTDRIEMLLKRAIQLDPSLSVAHLKLAEVFVQRDDYEDAVAEYKEALLQTQSAEAHYRLAQAYKRTDHAAESSKEMQLFLQLRAAKDRDTSGGVDLAQFVSALRAANEDAVRATTCTSGD